IAFTVGGAVAFGRAIADLAGEIDHLAAQTGLSTDEVQGLMAVADRTSTSMSAFVGAIQTLQQKIGSHDAGLVAAARELGVSLDALKTATPYDALITMTTALRDVDDGSRQAALGAD